MKLGIIELSKLSKEELIQIIRQKEFTVNNLRKDLRTISDKWRNYYRAKEYKKRTKK